MITLKGKWLRNNESNDAAINEILYILYNIQLSNVKANQSTSINTTLGSKYPFYRKNGIINYKTMSLQALITYESQFEEKTQWETEINPETGKPYGFITEMLRESSWTKIDLLTNSEQKQLNDILADIEEEEEKQKQIETFCSQVMNDYVLEQRFREKLLTFLLDGKPKIFESEQEGKMLVVVTDVSLTPMKELGRLYSSLQMTITEIGDATDTNLLQEYDLIEQAQDTQATINLTEIPKGEGESS